MIEMKSERERERERETVRFEENDSIAPKWPTFKCKQRIQFQDDPKMRKNCDNNKSVDHYFQDSNFGIFEDKQTDLSSCTLKKISFLFRWHISIMVSEVSICHCVWETNMEKSFHLSKAQQTSTEQLEKVNLGWIAVAIVLLFEWMKMFKLVLQLVDVCGTPKSTKWWIWRKLGEQHWALC